MRLNEGPLLLVSFTDHPQRTPLEERGLEFKDKNGNVKKGYGMYAALSYDEGKTWPVRKLLTDGEYRFLNGGAWTGYFEMDENHAEPRGYLAGTQTPDNVVHTLVADCITASIWHGSKNKIKKVCFCCPFPITSVVL